MDNQVLLSVIIPVTRIMQVCLQREIRVWIMRLKRTLLL